MTREETTLKIIDMAKAITEKNSVNWTRETENNIWRICLDWNNEHEDDEIFMCVLSADSGDECDGFAIEDDYFYIRN